MNPIDLLEELVRIDSVNPSMGGPGEEAMVRRLSELFTELGLEVRAPEVAEGRRNVIAHLPGDPNAPTLLLEAHLDTVAMPEESLLVERTDERLIGRGASDTKAACAAMVAAIAVVADEADGTSVVFAGAVDEEAAMLGSRALVDQLPPVDGAIIGEPTSLAPVRVHNGLARFRVVSLGRSAHTSRAQLGVNAVATASRVVLALQDLRRQLEDRAHPLAGPALLTPAMIHGGKAPNVVPDRCELVVDRRLSPGESAGAALAEVDRILDELREGGAEIIREPPDTLLPPVETPATHPLVALAEDAVEKVLGRRIPAGGVPYGTDAANLSGRGGVPCVVLGPGSIDQAHTADEWVPLREVEQAVEIYAEIVRGFGRHAGSGASEEGRR
ncbi:MAG: M20 family metallopeptidase [Acidimicrobiia bacterium]